MTLMQISEPGEVLVEQRKKVAGIDLGTTNSLIAMFDLSNVRIIPDAQGRELCPSVVYYSKDEVIVGYDATAHLVTDSKNTIYSVKRLFGLEMKNLEHTQLQLPYKVVPGKNDMLCVETRHGKKTPMEISAEILKYLKKRAEDSGSGKLEGVVITVPAYFDDVQRQATKDAARLADLFVYRLLNEPTAAALAYGLDKRKEGIVAVYDLGGGTFDISILKLEKGLFQVLATGGDSLLGGDDFDSLIFSWVLKESNIKRITLTQQQYAELVSISRYAKELLTNQQVVNLRFLDWSGKLSRDEYNILIMPLVTRSLQIFSSVLHDANLTTNDVSEVVTVGGATRTHLIKEKLCSYVGKTPLTEIDPDSIVAVGASMQAEMLSGNTVDNKVLLLDVLPLSLGLETMGGLMEKIIYRNSQIPISHEKEFTTGKDGQTSMVIRIFQGERELVDHNRELGSFTLKGIPPMSAGLAKVRLTFRVDADGLLCVSAKELTSGVHSNVTVKTSYGLSEKDITNMLASSAEYIDKDLKDRRLKEKEMEADRVLEVMTIALKKNGRDLLNKEEYEVLQKQLRKLKKDRESGDEHIINAAIKRVSKSGEFFAQRRIDMQVRRALTGKYIDDLED